MDNLATSEIVIIIFVLALFFGAIAVLVRFGLKKLSGRSRSDD